MALMKRSHTPDIQCAHNTAPDAAHVRSLDDGVNRTRFGVYSVRRIPCLDLARLILFSPLDHSLYPMLDKGLNNVFVWYCISIQRPYEGVVIFRIATLFLYRSIIFTEQAGTGVFVISFIHSVCLPPGCFMIMSNSVSIACISPRPSASQLLALLMLRLDQASVCLLSISHGASRST